MSAKNEGVRVERMPGGHVLVTLMGSVIAAKTVNPDLYRELTQDVLTLALDELDEVGKQQARAVIGALQRQNRKKAVTG